MTTTGPTWQRQAASRLARRTVRPLAAFSVLGALLSVSVAGAYAAQEPEQGSVEAVAASLTWYVTDQAGAPLEGTSFDLVGPARAGSPVSVTDNVAPDTNTTAGTITVDVPDQGSYTITADGSPEGYEPVTEVRTVTLSQDGPTPAEPLVFAYEQVGPTEPPAQEGDEAGAEAPPAGNENALTEPEPADNAPTEPEPAEDADPVDEEQETERTQQRSTSPRATGASGADSHDTATVTVEVGSDRVAGGVTGLAGVALALYDERDSRQPIDTGWAQCVSDGAGDCTFTVPDTGVDQVQECVLWVLCHWVDVPQDNRDRELWVGQVGTPDGYYSSTALGTGSSGSTQSAYRFRVGEYHSGGFLGSGAGWQLRAGGVYTSAEDFMSTGAGLGNTVSQGSWQVSRDNPTFPPSCGLDVALVLDLSGSISNSGDLGNLRSAAKGFVSALQGTPSQVGLYTFARTSPKDGTANHPLWPVSTPQGVQHVHRAIDGYDEALDGTNWDVALRRVAESEDPYDVAILVTDGSPTLYGSPATGHSSNTQFNSLEGGVHSANALKSAGTRVMAFGVGGGIDSVGAGMNLRAISGPQLDQDYFQSRDFDDAAGALRELALGTCDGSVSLVKQVLPADGDEPDAQPAGGWTFDASGAGVAPTTATTAADTGAASFGVTFPGGVSNTMPVTITERLRPGYRLERVSCTRIDTGAPVDHDRTGEDGFRVDASPAYGVTCTVYNRELRPAVHIDKAADLDGDGTPEASPGADGAPAVPSGTQVTWTYTVTNTGNVTLRNLVVTDDRLATGDVTCRTPDGRRLQAAAPIPQLDAGQSTTCTATGPVTARSTQP